MGKKFIIDTNVLIDAQTRRLPETSMDFLAEIINENFIVSFITYIEFLGYKEATQATKDFICLAKVIEVNKLIIENCIFLRKAQNIKLPDAIIAATALSLDYTLITNNDKDFSKISNLKTINLYRL